MQKLLPLMLFMVTTVFAEPTETPATSTTTQTNKSSCTQILADQRRSDTSKASLPLTSCEKLMFIANLNGKQYEEAATSATVDRKVTCIAKGGYTIDYDSCNRVKVAYNAAVVAEQALFAQQKIRIDENNAQQAADVAAAQQSGDLQNAAIEAAKNRSKQNAEMFREQAGTYWTAVAGLSSTLGLWKNKGTGAISRFCGSTKKGKSNKADTSKSSTEQSASTEADKNATVTNDYLKTDLAYTGTDVTCESVVTENKNSLFSNNDARGMFWMLTAEMLKKAAEATKKAGISDQVAKQIDEAKVLDDDETDVLVGCDQQPNLPQCQSGSNEHTTAELGGSSMDFGGAGVGQSFDLGANATGDLNGPSGSTGTVDKDAKVASHASPFENLAKQAKGIIDPASEAKVSAGQNPSGGGGGGGGGGGSGGGGGGGSNKSKGGEDAKEPVGAKVSGKYKASEGGGYTGVKGGKDNDENPLAGLFENKGASGGIEEDRSIGADIDGASSGLFQKISKRYGQVQQDKRIQSQNLE